MDAQTLCRIMDNPDAARYVDEVNQAMALGNINTKNRVAGFLGVYVGEESLGMRAKEEYRNNQMYRYAPYIGRTFGQLTWDFNYRAFGYWLHAKRPDLLADPMLFVNNPPALAEDKYAVLGALWFWLTHGLNDYADAGNVWQMTQTINGGQNGAAERLRRWNLIRSIPTDQLLPEDDMTPDEVNKLIDARMQHKWLPFITTRIRNAMRARTFGGNFGVWTTKDAWNAKHKRSILSRKGK